jgi:diguanylate cyclase (GGDEF)-like protein/putative nucleotidyltransferase with HDIG domain
MKGNFLSRSFARQPQGVVLLFYGILAALLAAVLPMQARPVQLLFAAAQVGAALWALTACLRAVPAREDQCGEECAVLRRAWVSLAVAMGIFAVAMLMYFALAVLPVQANWLHLSADGLRVLQQPFLLFAIWSLARSQMRRTEHAVQLLRISTDALMVVLSLFVLFWLTLLWPVMMRAGSTPGTHLLWLVFSILNFAALLGALLFLFSTRGRLRETRIALALCGGIACFLGANASLFFQTYNATARAGSTPDAYGLQLGWVWAGVMIGLAALTQRAVNTQRAAGRTAESESTRRHAVGADDETIAAQESNERHWQQLIIIWLPYIAVLIVCFVLIGSELKSGQGMVQRVLPALLLLCAVIARQMLTLLDNLRLSERLQGMNLSLEVVNSDLEKNVAERTQHLSTLHGITSTLNTSLDRRTVLRVALERTIAATGADSGGIWLRLTEKETTPDPQANEKMSAESWEADNWEMAHSSGFGDNLALENMLRDLAVSAAQEQGTPLSLLPSTRSALQFGFAPSPNNVVLVPIRWGGALLGAFGLLRHSGSFTYDDRALVESVALETGTALQNARLYQEARHRADRDSVTGLLNHRAVQERLNEALSKARRAKTDLSVVMMDLNNFKFFNDTYGHPTGDEVLRTVARYLREVCRDSDVVGRYGGDEFIALLPQTDAVGAQDFANRVAARLGEQHFQADSGSRIPIEMAFGWAIYPRDADSALELLTAADANLYEYKHSGGLSRTPSRLEANEQGRIEVRKLKDRSAGGSFGVLDALVTAIDNKDHYTRRHSEEVTHYSILVARELGYSEEALRAVRISGLLHDVGKIAVPDEILRHPGQLGEDEWKIMQQHPSFGALIVKDLPHLDEVLDGVRHHHERWDGKGYPDGLREENIPKMGRLLAVGDCFSAMTTNRPYRKAFAPEDALREIERGVGIQFDPVISTAFVKVMRRELAAAHEEGEDAHKPQAPDFSEEMREEFALLPSIAKS